MQLTNLTQDFGVKVKNASPYISFGVGAVSLGGTIFTCVRATMKLEPILDEYNKAKEELDGYFEEQMSGDITEDIRESLVKNHKKESRKLFLGLVGKIARLYGPTAGLALLSLGGFTYSAGMFRGMYLTTAGALTELSTQFDDYRENVREEYGDDVDEAMLYGLKKEKITVEETDPETGKTKKVKKEMLTGSPDGLYSYRFEKYDWQTGEGSTQWDPSHMYNESYIMAKLACFQNNLNAGKKVHLDRLLDELGFENTGAIEHMAGWLPGDIIECGLEDGNATKYADTLSFINGESPDVTLRFNPRPDILGMTELFGIKDDVYKIIQDDNTGETTIESITDEERSQLEEAKENIA